jgi:predicted amidophosphoribosyltransferase
LGEVERVMRMEESGAAGTCPSCDAVHSRGAVYCWQCGQPLFEPAASRPVAEDQMSA